MQVTSGNYATVAKADDPRAARIALAVERSRVEYLPRHAYTERVAERTLVDKHSLEYLVSGLYYSHPRRALDLILEVADLDKPLAGLSRELVDTATRAALACGDVENGLKFARTGRSFVGALLTQLTQWKAPFVGLAESAADALVAAGEGEFDRNVLKDPLPPLVSAGPHASILSRLAAVLSTREGPQIRAFHSLLSGQAQTVDVETLAAELGVSDLAGLQRMVRKVEGGVPEEQIERSVRDL